MKTGRTLSQLAAEIERQAAAKRDYLAETTAIEMVPAEAGEGMQLVLAGNGAVGVNSVAHDQMAAGAEEVRPRSPFF